MKAIYRFSATPIKIPLAIFTEIEKKSKICVEPQKTLNSQSNLRKKYKAVGITLPDFTQYYKATVIKTAYYWHKNRRTDQCNRIESPEINPHLWTINLQQRRQEYTMEKRQSLQQVVLGKLDSHT